MCLLVLEISMRTRLLSRTSSSLAFVPKHRTAQEEDISKLQQFLDKSEKLVVITGAGISTESGIPDYRSEGVGLYATSSKRPIQHKVFLESHAARQSYWARNFVGWPRWSGFLPHINHLCLARWEEAGRDISRTLIGRAPTLLPSHWSRAAEC